MSEWKLKNTFRKRSELSLFAGRRIRIRIRECEVNVKSEMKMSIGHEFP